jgi:hypothetical protein
MHAPMSHRIPQEAAQNQDVAQKKGRRGKRRADQGERYPRECRREDGDRAAFFGDVIAASSTALLWPNHLLER